jgi:hypothetical protein
MSVTIHTIMYSDDSRRSSEDKSRSIMSLVMWREGIISVEPGRSPQLSPDAKEPLFFLSSLFWTRNLTQMAPEWYAKRVVTVAAD